MFRRKAKTFTRAQQLNELARFPGTTHSAESKSAWAIVVATAAGNHHVFIDLPPGFPQCAPRFHISPLLSHASADANGVISHSALTDWTPASRITEVIEAVIHPIIISPPVACTLPPQPHYESPPQVEGCATLEIAPKSEVPAEACDVQPQYYAPTQELIALSAAAAVPIGYQPMYAQPMYSEPMSAPPMAGMQSQVISSAPLSAASAAPMSAQPTAEMQPITHPITHMIVAVPVSKKKGNTGPVLVESTAKVLTANNGFDPMLWESREPLYAEVSEDTSEISVRSNSCSVAFEWRNLCTVLLWASVAWTAVTNKPVFPIVLTAIFYVCCIIEVIRGRTLHYLSNVIELQQLEKFKAQAPYMHWNIHHYHTITRSVGGGGYSSTKKVRVTVNTAMYEGGFIYNVWSDLSQPLPKIDRYSLTRARIGVKTHFANEFTAQEFKRQRRHFFTANTGKKVDTFEGVSLEGLSADVLVEVDSSQRPAYMTKKWFLIASAMGLSCCFRHFLWANIGSVNYDFYKRVFAVAGDSQQIAKTDFTELVVNPTLYVPPKPKIKHYRNVEDGKDKVNFYVIGAKKPAVA